MRKKIGLHISHGELTKIKLVLSELNQPYEKISKRGGIWKGASRKERNLLREDVEDFEHEREKGGGGG